MPSARTKWFRPSISLKISILFSLLFTVGLIGALSATYFQISRSLEKSSREVIGAKSAEAESILKAEGINGLKDFFSEEKNRILNAPYMIRVLSRNDEPLYLKASVQEKNFDFEHAFQAEKISENLLGWHSIAAIDDEDKFDILTQRVGNNFYLQVGKSSEDREDILGDILNVLFLTGSLFIVLSAVLGILYAKKILEPIRNMLSAIQMIERGDFSKRVELQSSRDELRDLGETFNRMITKIESLLRMMRESLDNVAHDIRTPLTRIKFVAEDALLSPKDEGSVRSALEDCAEYAGELSDMVDQVLSISEAETDTLKLKIESCEVTQLVRSVVEVYEFVCLEKEILVLFPPMPSIYWALDKKRMKQVIGNLLDNAIKFSPKRTSIQINIEERSFQLAISILDQGIGVTDSDLPRIWDRLYRGDKSRSTKGMGLGLSIVKSIVRAHSGEVHSERNLGPGMKFSIVLPKIQKP
jgi:signal transduction histidine kinase